MVFQLLPKGDGENRELIIASWLISVVFLGFAVQRLQQLKDSPIKVLSTWPFVWFKTVSSVYMPDSCGF